MGAGIGWRLTIHSSRRRFAARLNSGVRRRGNATFTATHKRRTTMKSLLIALLLAVTTTASAASAVGDAVKTANPFDLDRCEQNFSSNLESQSKSGALLIARNDVGQCMGACASEQGICIGQCQGNGQCISNCAAAHGRCVARCN